jgi:hypothetical protein
MHNALHCTPDPALCCGLPARPPVKRAAAPRPHWRRLAVALLTPAMRLHRYRHLTVRAVEDVIERSFSGDGS